MRDTNTPRHIPARLSALQAPRDPGETDFSASEALFAWIINSGNLISMLKSLTTVKRSWDIHEQTLVFSNSAMPLNGHCFLCWKTCKNLLSPYYNYKTDVLFGKTVKTIRNVHYTVSRRFNATLRYLRRRLSPCNPSNPAGHCTGRGPAVQVTGEREGRDCRPRPLTLTASRGHRRRRRSRLPSLRQLTTRPASKASTDP